ncbi:hypothetical protein C8R47DRAFT_1121307 [Mycena vitilis]|nr:hypothetical protein C8R47DRAFT_1121307 [Mycena vitilis]
MTLLLHNLPSDIILAVVNFMELPDPLSLLLTCSSLYSLSSLRSFWISILETARKKAPIACPLHADLAQYSVESLKLLVVSWLKLRDNWDRAFPQITQPVASTCLPVLAEIIFNVQGTDILVLNMGGNILCWDAKLAVPFPFAPIDTSGGHITDVSPPSEVRGVCTLALITAQVRPPHIAHKYVVTIRHEEGKLTGYSSERSEVSSPDGPHFQSLFVTQEAVGSIVSMEAESECMVSLGAVNGSSSLISDSVSTLKLHHTIASNTHLIVCFAYKGHLFNLLEDGLSVQIQHISRRSLRSGHCEEFALFNCEILSPSNNLIPFCFMIPSTPFYGVGAVFVRLEWDDEDESNSRIAFTFLPTTLTHATDDGISSPLAFDSPCVTEYVPGRLVNLGLVWMDHSGFNVAVVVQSDMPRLLAVRYHPKMKRVSVHTLTVPDTVQLNDLHSVCIDDTAGAVHLIDRQGIFSTLRYI